MPANINSFVLLISLVFSKFSKLPSSFRDSGNFDKTLKIRVKLILNCPRALAITYTKHFAHPKPSLKLLLLFLLRQSRELRQKGVLAMMTEPEPGRKASLENEHLRNFDSLRSSHLVRILHC